MTDKIVSSSFSLGSGEANFDSFESNPFQNSKQRQEQEVQTLLQKLSHEMIGLDASFVGTLDKGTTQHFKEFTSEFLIGVQLI